MARAPLAIAAAVIGFVLPHAVLVAAAGGAEDKETPLTNAAAGELQTVKPLIAQGADVQARNKKGDTPLHVACEKGHLAVARHLVENGAPVGGKGYFGKTPVDIRARFGATLLHFAAEGRYIPDSIAEMLIAKGADVNARNEGGLTPLKFARGRDKDALVKTLLKHGAKE